MAFFQRISFKCYQFFCNFDVRDYFEGDGIIIVHFILKCTSSMQTIWGVQVLLFQL